MLQSNRAARPGIFRNFFGALLRFGAGAFILAFTGCSSPGPNHLYIATAGGESIHDVPRSGAAPVQIPSRTTTEEKVLGLGYDAFTDELFVRLAPGNIVRVIDRPSKRHLRDMSLPGLAPTTAHPLTADLSVRWRNRHLFLVDADGRSVVEYTLFGEFVGRIPAGADTDQIGGLAFDQKRDRLLVLLAGPHPSIVVRTLDGREEARYELHAAVLPLSLAYDSTAEHLFVPMPGGKSIGVFDLKGNHLSTTQSPDLAGDVTALAAGDRSFVRIF